MLIPMPLPLPLPILERLKLGTRARHVALESRTVLMDKDLSHTNYHQCLQRFFGYYVPLEKRMLASPAWHEIEFLYNNRNKTPQLVQDLCELGFKQHVLDALPRCNRLPELVTAAQLLGCLYVIEGATLGGQIITKHLSARLDITPESGGSFFAGYGHQTGSHWKAFGAGLTAFATQVGSDEEIISSANSTFKTLDYWLYPTQIQDNQQKDNQQDSQQQGIP
ncbi:MAG: biliverdin-producing heme oxygenase [Methylophilaceae bacterium]|nr:biliverdin-producing heme oxygenase [Methylophilaceae bacterium]